MTTAVDADGAVLDTNVLVYAFDKEVVRMNQLSAARVFDAQLAATMLANGVRRIYTFDRAHFECFVGIEVATPRSP